MELTQDFKELLVLLNENQVKYLVVGGYAVNQYGYPRYTHDIDLWVWMNKVNAQNILRSLSQFGFSEIGIVKEDFLKPDNILQLGYPPHRVDIMTSSDGLKFEDAYMSVNNVEIDGIPIPFISLKNLILNKKTTGRSQDLADADNLIKINRSNLEDE